MPLARRQSETTCARGAVAVISSLPASVLDDSSRDVARGKVVCSTGASGSDTSTVLRCMEGLASRLPTEVADHVPFRDR